MRLAEAVALAAIWRAHPTLLEDSLQREPREGVAALGRQIIEVCSLLINHGQEITANDRLPECLRAWLHGMARDENGLMYNPNPNHDHLIEGLMRLPIRMWLCKIAWRPEDAFTALAVILKRYMQSPLGQVRGHTDTWLDGYFDLVFRSLAVTEFQKITTFLARIWRICCHAKPELSARSLLGSLMLSRQYLCFLVASRKPYTLTAELHLLRAYEENSGARGLADKRPPSLNYEAVTPGSLCGWLQGHLCGSLARSVRRHGFKNIAPVISDLVQAVGAEVEALVEFWRQRTRGESVPKGVAWYFDALEETTDIDGRLYWQEALDGARNLLTTFHRERVLASLEHYLIPEMVEPRDSAFLLGTMRKTRRAIEGFGGREREILRSEYYWSEQEVGEYFKGANYVRMTAEGQI